MKDEIQEDAVRQDGGKKPAWFARASVPTCFPVIASCTVPAFKD